MSWSGQGVTSQAEASVAKQEVILAELREHCRADLARMTEKNLKVMTEIVAIAREHLSLEEGMAGLRK
jgi:hypothetical protein